MKRLTQVIAGATLAFVLSTTPAYAQGAEFSLGGGVGLPLGDFDDVSKLGWHGLAGLSFVPSNSPVGIQIDGQYHQYNLDEDVVVGGGDLKNRLIFGTANAVYKFSSAEGTRFRPYLIGGGGVYNLKTTGDDDVGGVIDTDNSTTKFGINAGAGFDFKAGSAGLFIEGRFHNVFTEGSNTTFIPITLGIRLGGS
ncbi:MAG TPA: outer membrane beta-barrel protein [Gemmatimonadales bacterium]|nr:outer membrane beta-barrel protein [Gemmatimonadales bacterium]